MANRKIKDFFNGRFFEIPKYQRSFAWEKENVRELFDDINEAMETSSNHYIGTIILSKKCKEAKKCKEDDTFYIVDGQQRIATITLIINELVKYLPEDDASFYYRFYIKEDKKFRLKMLGRDNEYYSNLLNGTVNESENRSQQLLKEAYEEIQLRTKNINDKKEFLKSMERLEMMEFIEETEGDAIRIFQTVNDRGKPLSNMEKAKSLLIYFSNRYLDKKLDDKINELFGEIFELYDDIKHIGGETNISLIKSKEFNEDNIMRYHFVTFSDENYDATAPYVLNYLKERLISYRKEDKLNKHGMEAFINNYVESLHSFFKSLKAVLERTRNNEKYYKIFGILGISATLYPLLVKLEILGILENSLPDKEYNKYTFLDLLEIIDVRIYKIRSDPRAEISRFAYEVNNEWEEKEIQDWLLSYNRRWMNKEEFLTRLNEDVYKNMRTALPYIFIEYCEELEGKKYSIDELRMFVDKEPTIEHILSKTPKFTYKSVGFKNSEHLLEYEGTLGNLTILEKNINSAVQNKIPFEKVPFYDKSSFKMTREVASLIHTKKKFDRVNIEERTKYLINKISTRWWC